MNTAALPYGVTHDTHRRVDVLGKRGSCVKKWSR
jgi:hypothetical protein